MSEIQAEQKNLQEENQQALKVLEEKYQKQIFSLQDHLQKVVADNDAKDRTIKQVCLSVCPSSTLLFTCLISLLFPSIECSIIFIL